MSWMGGSRECPVCSTAAAAAAAHAHVVPAPPLSPPYRIYPSSPSNVGTCIYSATAAAAVCCPRAHSKQQQQQRSAPLEIWFSIEERDYTHTSFFD